MAFFEKIQLDPKWDKRYSSGEFIYGKKPNDFLVSISDKLPRGRVLCLADGQGRNGVYLAERGCQVTSVDGSAVGLRKAKELAKERGVQIKTVVSNLVDYNIRQESWDAIVSIFCHLPSKWRALVHNRVVSGLQSGGTFVLEAYRPAQLELKTGGPPHADLMISLSTLREELAGLRFQHAEELERDVVEGRQHTGRGAVVQVLALKP